MDAVGFSVEEVFGGFAVEKKGVGSWIRDLVAD